ncbi:MAG TPA: oxidoreductase [Chryseosolibacter sp.]|nr:oxidoreductase [Chryseosolibacter sp.]
MKTALIAGSTGLVGRNLLSLILSDERYASVVAVTRKDLGISHRKLVQVKTDLSTLAENSSALKCDDVFCCLGTTMAKAGSKEKFREADFDYPARLGSLTKSQGASKYFLVSALGADAASSIFYNKVKGETEAAIREIGFPSLHIFRPSLLLGERNESRPGEEAAKVFFRLFGFLVPSKYKGIRALTVAKAMVHFAHDDREGVFVHESKEMQKFQ